MPLDTLFPLIPNRLGIPFKDNKKDGVMGLRSFFLDKDRLLSIELSCQVQ